MVAYINDFHLMMLVVLLAAGQGLANGAEAAFNDDATNSVWIHGGRTRKPHHGQPRNRRIRMTNDDVMDLYTRAKVGTKVIVQR